MTSTASSPEATEVSATTTCLYGSRVFPHEPAPIERDIVRLRRASTPRLFRYGGVSISSTGMRCPWAPSQPYMWARVDPRWRFSGLLIVARVTVSLMT
jgi:hypothetical protein